VTGYSYRRAGLLDGETWPGGLCLLCDKSQLATGNWQPAISVVYLCVEGVFQHSPCWFCGLFIPCAYVFLMARVSLFY
jgi:hypothetical protein